MLEKETAAAIGQMLEMWSKRGLQWAPKCDPIVPRDGLSNTTSVASQASNAASASKSPLTRETSPKSTSGHSNAVQVLEVPAPVISAPIVSAPVISAGAQTEPIDEKAATDSNRDDSLTSKHYFSSEGGPSPWRYQSFSLNEREEQFSRMKLDVAACTKCSELACSRKQTVFGVGNLKPRVAFFGEAPGAEEDKSGVPFVGPAGQLLNKIIEATTMKREDVYILNSLRCRPPMNRTPTETEIENCRPFFEAQLEVLQPEYIVCLGAVAVRAVLRRTETIGRLRGKFYAYGGAKVLVTYHPSYLLRNADVKKLAWQDMQFLMRDMGIPVPGAKS